LPVGELRRLVPEYLNDCELRFLSPHTIETRRAFLNNLLWFLVKRGYARCGTAELRQFFHYLLHGHEDKGGRFGKTHLNRPVRPITLKDYYVGLRSLFDWLLAAGVLAETPFAAIPQPQVRDSIKAPLAPAQIALLVEAAGQSAQPRRDVAVLSFLLDTGCRASELIAIQQADLDLANRCCQVVGKGNKYRTIYFGQRTAEALLAYLESTEALRSATRITAKGFIRPMPLFLSERSCAGKRMKPLTRSGLLQLLERLGRQCGIKASCSPHALRRSFAIQTLRNGANVFSVQAMLGHTNLQMTQKYCAIALADVAAQHRQFGPLDRMGAEALRVSPTTPAYAVHWPANAMHGHAALGTR
jgi:site-specific recombinase XerD